MFAVSSTAVNFSDINISQKLLHDTTFFTTATAVNTSRKCEAIEPYTTDGSCPLAFIAIVLASGSETTDADDDDYVDCKESN